jgi:hypothetical protein
MDRLVEEPIEITLHADNINRQEGFKLSKAWNRRTILQRHSKSQRLGKFQEVKHREDCATNMKKTIDKRDTRLESEG